MLARSLEIDDDSAALGNLDAVRCAALWRAVIARAWRDAFEAADAELTFGVRKDRAHLAQRQRERARRWLVSSLDPWRNDRQDVCDAADVDASALRAAAMRRLATVKAAEVAAEPGPVVERTPNAALDFSDALAKLVNSDLPTTEIDAALARLADLERAAA